MWWLTTCGRKFVTPDVWELIRWTQIATELKYLPVDGGALAQTACFVEALGYVSLQESRMRARLGKK